MATFALNEMQPEPERKKVDLSISSAHSGKRNLNKRDSEAIKWLPWPPVICLAV